MLAFENDYSEGAHPSVLQRLVETNLEQQPGYGTDRFCASAQQKIREACGCPQAEVRFLVGGTQTNRIVISALLHNTEGVVAADTGHVNGHEAGAIESSGHKVLAVPHDGSGKLSAAALRACLTGFWGDQNHDHMVFPGMAYISHPTEYGTLYTKDELAALSAVCREFDIPLFLDGARLGYALACPDSNVTLQDLARYCTVFYIGGTKVGALCGEAVVFPQGNVPHRFITTVKQNGALLAKGRLLGVQFDALFTDGLYERISRNAIETAALLRQALREKGYRFHLETPTNQLFIVLEDAQLARLQQQVRVSFWEKADETHTVIRLATSWATRTEDVQALIALL